MMDDARIAEFFDSVGQVSIRPVFGGKGIYLNGKIIAFQRKDELLVKGDKKAAAKIEKAGGVRMSYRRRKGRRQKVYLPYWSVPESAYDDADEMARWVKIGVDASKRAGK
ncbi:TfoX/Sxy family protein [Gordonia terrae]|uniref:TfoX/Sxy family protein n=1 Tax=Gordonia terrae TaxID=2055 RepID=UPI003F6BE960